MKLNRLVPLLTEVHSERGGFFLSKKFLDTRPSGFITGYYKMNNKFQEDGTQKITGLSFSYIQVIKKTFPSDLKNKFGV